MRQLRADFAGALHHVYSRGIDGRDIFRDDRDRLFFFYWLGQVVEKFGWIVHVYTLMSNHFHLMIETPEPRVNGARCVPLARRDRPAVATLWHFTRC